MTIKKVSIIVTIISLAITVIGLIYSKVLFKNYLKEVKELNNNINDNKQYIS